MEDIEKPNRKKFQKSLLIISISIGILIVILINLFWAKVNLVNTNDFIYVKHIESGTLLKLEKAETSYEHARGLMYRTDLQDNEGMIFIFDNSKIRNFWMLNTPQSLDMIFLDENFKIINFYLHTIPNQTETLYYSNAPAKYVLEIKSGFIEKVNLKNSDTFEII